MRRLHVNHQIDNIGFTVQPVIHETLERGSSTTWPRSYQQISDPYSHKSSLKSSSGSLNSNNSGILIRNPLSPRNKSVSFSPLPSRYSLEKGDVCNSYNMSGNQKFFKCDIEPDDKEMGSKCELDRQKGSRSLQDSSAHGNHTPQSVNTSDSYKLGSSANIIPIPVQVLHSSSNDISEANASSSVNQDLLQSSSSSIFKPYKSRWLSVRRAFTERSGKEPTTGVKIPIVKVDDAAGNTSIQRTPIPVLHFETQL